MSSKVDWRQKYLELRSKYLNAVDVAFRLGMQEGLKQGQIDSMQQQMQQQQQQMAEQQQMAAQQASMGGMPGEDEGGMPPGEAGGEMSPEEQQQMAAQQGGIPGEQQQGPAQDELDLSMQELESYLKSEKHDPRSLMKAFHKVKDAKKVNDEKQVDAKNKKVVNDILAKWEIAEKKAADKLQAITQK